MNNMEFPQQPSKRDELIEAQEQITRDRAFLAKNKGYDLPISPLEEQISSIDSLNQIQDDELKTKTPQEADQALTEKVAGEYEHHFGPRYAADLGDRLSEAEVRDATTFTVQSADDLPVLEQKILDEVRIQHAKGMEPTFAEEVKFRDALGKIYRNYVENQMLSPLEANFKIAEELGFVLHDSDKQDEEFIQAIVKKIVTPPDKAHLN